VYVQGEPLKIARSPTVVALLAYLLTEPGPHPREQLAVYFWPDSTPRQAQQNLRQVLYRLRKLLDTGEEGRTYVTTDRQMVHFDADDDVWIDVSVFENLLGEVREHAHRRAAVCLPCIARLEKAARLYRGAFVEGLGNVGSIDFEQWLLLWREALQQRAVWAFHVLAEHHLAHGRVLRARTFVRRLLHLDPWNEAAERLHLQVIHKLEGRNAALQEYRRFAEALSAELGVMPEDETRTLAERLEGADSGDWRPIGVLPAPVTPFFGREEERRQLLTYLAQREQRLITLVGAGGGGKTRLALEVAQAQQPDWRDGVWFVPLARVDTAQRLPDVIVDTLLPASRDPRPLSARLFDFLRQRELLLLLDNFEHLVPEGTTLVRDLLRHAPHIKVLVTSQAPLGVPEEWVIHLAGLDLPPAERGLPAAELRRYSAVRLFLHHTRRVAPDWAPEGKDWSHILRLCRQVDGLPLGIELAAAWLRSLSLGQMVAAGDADLDFFHGGASDDATGHHSLRATFARAYTLLSEQARRLFRQLAVFRGGFDLQAAGEISGASVTELAQLVDRSLLQAVGPERWDWHPLLHRYAVELLEARPREAQEIRERHAVYYRAFIQAREERLWGEGVQEALSEVDVEIENVEAAWKWALDRRDVPALVQSLDVLALYYYLKGLFSHAEEVFATAARRLSSAESDEGHRALVARLWAAEAEFLTRQGHSGVAIERSKDAVAWAEAAHDRYAELRASLALGHALRQQEEHQAAFSPLQRALTLTQVLLDEGASSKTRLRAIRCLRAESHRILASLLWKASHYVEAQEHLRQAEELDRRIGDLMGAGWTHNNLGLVLENMGHYDQAIGHYRQALTLFRRTHDLRGESFALGNLGYLHSRVGRYEEARKFYRRDLRICEDMGDRRGRCWTLDNLSLMATREGRYADAHQYARQALQIAQEIQNPALEAHIWTQMGRALAGVGQLAEAGEAYRKAACRQRELGSLPLALEAQAGQVWVALAQNDVRGALTQAEEILAYLEDEALDRTDDQLGIYLICYRALQANADPRAAPFLQRACRLLETQAACINDITLRRSFLESVPSHRALRAVCEARESGEVLPV